MSDGSGKPEWPHPEKSCQGEMFASILPEVVRVSVRTADEPESTLFPVERRHVAAAVAGRRGEFAAGRACARDALAQLGMPNQPVPAGQKGEPIWPCGVVGSITHCAGLRASVVAHSSDLITLGIDAEPNDRLPSGVPLCDICVPDEAHWLDDLSSEAPDATVHWDRLLFCMKETVYKAWYPLTRRWLGFEDAVISIDPSEGTFQAKLLVKGPWVGSGELRSFSGRWREADGFLLAAIAMPASQ